MRFNEQKLLTNLQSLPEKHRVAFAASCCERMLPNYCAFSQMEHWGDPRLLREALDRVWQFLEGEPLHEETVRASISTCLTQAPNSNSFSSLFVGAAQDAVSAICYTLECCLDGDAQRAALVGRLTVYVLDGYIGILTNPYLEVEIQARIFRESIERSGIAMTEAERQVHIIKEVQKQHQAFLEWVWQSPLISAELEKQNRDISMLRSSPKITTTFLNALRRSATESGIKPFQRGLVK